MKQLPDSVKLSAIVLCHKNQPRCADCPWGSASACLGEDSTELAEKIVAEWRAS